MTKKDDKKPTRWGRQEILADIFKMVGIPDPPRLKHYMTRRNLIHLHTWIKSKSEAEQ